MKSNGIKYFFIIFVIVILVFAIYIIRTQEEKDEQVQSQSSENGPDKIKEIRLAVAEFDTINPILSKNKNVQDITKLVYEPLITLTSDYKAEGSLAKEWAKQSETSYLVKLKENVRWSDGQIFTAEDVQFTIDKIRETSSVYLSNIQNIASVDIVDDFTITFNLNQEEPFFEYNLTFPILSKEYYDQEDFVNTEKNNMPIGTGMYKISETYPSYITLVKNPNWRDSKEKELTLEKITVNLYSSVGEMYNSFKIGNIDMTATDNTNLSQYIGTIGYSSKEIKGREHTFLILNTARYLLSKQEVRRAISYSIDKDNIVSTTLGGNALTSSFPLDYGNWLANEQEASSGYNPEQAKQVLTEAGWSYRNRTWQKTENRKTQTITLNLLVRASNNSQVKIAENIKAQLANQGIVVNIQQLGDEQYQNNMNTKNYDIALCSMYVSPSPNMNLFFGENNLANYNTEEITNIMNEVKNTNDNEIIKERYKRLIEIYKNDIPYISLCNNKYIIAYSSTLVGDINPNWFNEYYGIEGWYK